MQAHIIDKDDPLTWKMGGGGGGGAGWKKGKKSINQKHTVA